MDAEETQVSPRTTEGGGPRSKEADSAIPKSGGMSAPFVGSYELANVAYKVTNLIASTPGNSIFGQPFTSPDPVITFFKLMLERKVPAVLRREIIPGDPDTVECVDIRQVLCDEEILRANLEFKIANTSLLETDDYIGSLKALAKVGEAGSLEVDGTPYAEEDLVDEADEDDAEDGAEDDAEGDE